MPGHIQLQSSDGHTLQAYAAEPTGRPRGAVVVVQEIFGINSHIRQVADGYAADGYLAIAPALFDRVQAGYETGYQPADVQAGVAVKNQISNEQALADVQAAIEACAARGAGKVGVVGYCWGGTIAWLAAAQATGLAAAVAYYGGGVPDLIDQTPKVPVMLHFGETDQSIPVEKARSVAARHPTVETYFYPAGHGFNCDQRGSFHEPSAKQARERTLKFLGRWVG